MRRIIYNNNTPQITFTCFSVSPFIFYTPFGKVWEHYFYPISYLHSFTCAKRSQMRASFFRLPASPLVPSPRPETVKRTTDRGARKERETPNSPWRTRNRLSFFLVYFASQVIAMSLCACVCCTQLVLWPVMTCTLLLCFTKHIYYILYAPWLPYYSKLAWRYVL